MRNVQKILAVILCTVMLAAVLPCGALAEEFGGDTEGTSAEIIAEDLREEIIPAKGETMHEIEEQGEMRLFAADAAALQGSGTAADPYRIYTQDDLLAIDTYPAASYSLQNDIVVTYDTWTPIGASTAFSGSFDGNGYTISGVVLEGSGYDYTGLFGQNSGLIENLKVDATLSASNYVGGLVAYNTGTIKNCVSSGSVTNTSSGNTGGLVGYNYNGTITTSGSTATVTGGSNNTGGLIGYNRGYYNIASITNCYAQGNVTGTGTTGGLLGYNSYSGDSYNAVIRNCYASGKVNDGEGAGLIGNNSGRVYNSYYRSINDGNEIGFSISTTNMKKQDTFYCWDFNNIWIINGDYPVINVRGEDTYASMSGGGTASNPYIIENEQQLYALAVDMVTTSSSTYYKLANDITINTKYWTPIGIYNSFSGTFDGNGYTISGVATSGTDYSYVGLFGQNSGTIKNLTVNGSISGNSYAGVLAGYSDGTITNCLSSGSVTNTSSGNTGGLVGYNYNGTITTSGSTATVTGGSNNTGGLIGYNRGYYNIASITNCYAQGNVTGTGTTGGLLGYNSYSGDSYNAVIRNCYASGKVNDGEGAGLIGSNSGRVYNSYYRSINTGNETGFSVSTTNMKKESAYYFWDFDNTWEINGGYPYINIRGEESEIVFDGDGDIEEPYYIENEQQLYALSMDLAKTGSKIYYQLANDITITAMYWTPIGVYDAYIGVFDGNGYTISGAAISGTDYSYVGLFGQNSGTIQNLTVNGNINGMTDAGVLVGHNNEGTIVNCYSSGNVSADSSTGGLIGYNYNGVIKTSGSSAVVSGESGYVGGLIGHNRGYYNLSTVTNCYAQGNVTGENNNAGGLIGYNSYSGDSANAAIRNCYASGSVNSNSGAGLIGSNSGRIYNSYYNAANTGNTVGFAVSSDNLKNQSTYYFWDFDNTWEINGGYPYINVRGEEPEIEFDGDGDIETPYFVETEQQLYALSMDLAKTGSKIYYQLANDITITAMYWTPIGVYDAYIGVFDGNGYTISGAAISGTDYSYVGLFGQNSGTIQNLTVNGNISGTTDAGILAGYNNGGTITNCFSSGSVSANSSTGGLIGYNYNGIITTSASTATVTGGSSDAGGLIGHNHGYYNLSTITNCYAQGNVTSTGRTGGLIGYNSYSGEASNSAITNCYSTGVVSSTSSSSGGLIGSNSGTVTASYYNTETSGKTDSTKGTPLSTDDMKNNSSYVGWDFDTIWAISSSVNEGYPYLRAIEPVTSVEVTSVTLNKASLSLTKGEKQTLIVTVSPSDATNKTVTWTSSNTSVATVSNGIVTAKSAGTATITVTTADGGYSASCIVTVIEETSPVIVGDVNGDGEIDFADAILILKHDAGVSSLTGDGLNAADVNGDGEVDFVDAILVLKYDSGLIPSFD